MSSNDLEKEVGIPAAAEAAVDDFEPDPTTIPIWSKNLVLAILCSMCIGLAGQMLNPTLPLYTVEIGFSEQMAGIMLTAFSIGSLLFRPIAGQLVDYIGRRKMVLCGSLLVAFSFLLYLMSTNFYMILCVRVMQGIGFCLTNTGIGTVASDIIPKARITEGIGYYALAGAISMTVGPAVGLELKNMFSMRGDFIGGLLLASICIVASRFISYEEKLKTRKPGEKIKISLFEKTSLLPASMIFTATVAQTSLTAYLALYGRSIGLEGVSSFFLFTSVGTICARAFAGKVTYRLGEKKVLWAAVLVTTCCFFAVSFAKTMPVLIAIAIVYGFGYGVLYPVTNAMSIRNAIPENRGAANATYSASFDLGTIVGGSVWGIVVANLNYPWMYRLAAVLTLFIIPLTLIYQRKFVEWR